MNTPHQASQALQLTRGRRGAAVVLELAGELDMATTPLLEEALDALDGPRAVVLDLDGLTFIDSHGLHAIFRRVDTRTLILARPHPNIARVLKLTQGDRIVHVEDSLEAALQVGDNVNGRVGNVDGAMG